MDPLYVIFEQHLYSFHDAEMDRKAFLGAIIKEYLVYLRQSSITVPSILEAAVTEELYSQLNAMLVKKIYGCLNIEDFQRGLTPERKRKARKRYERLALPAPAEKKPA